MHSTNEEEVASSRPQQTQPPPQRLVYQSASLQVGLPEELKAAIQAWSHKHIPEEMILHVDPLNGDSLGRVDDSHVTLKVGLYEEDFDKVVQLVGDTKALEIRFNPKRPLHLFSTRRYLVLVANVVPSQELLRLHHLLSRKLANAFAHQRAFRPHCTVCYVKREAEEELNRCMLRGKAEFPVVKEGGGVVVADRLEFVRRDASKSIFCLGRT
ncbi:hypothetical protein QOT17_012406 [Balamuthia mandrillaris]